MSKYRKPRSARTLRPIVLSAAILLALSAQAQEASGENEVTEIDKISVIGSRARGHTATETPAPVDIITEEQLNATGATEVGQILQMLQPSFNFSRTFVSDGTDIIRPATLRGLGPDQVLVLINGKRRHQQALVNVQQTIGRGSAGTDINAIPVSAIGRIEVLRDGAAAQYGSDAIAGVINIVLKRNSEGHQASVQAGQTYEGDGRTLQGSVNSGFELGSDGFLNLSAEYRDREETNRAGLDSLRVSPPAVTQRLGDPDATDAYLWFNGGKDFMDDHQFYFFGGYSKREGNSSGFFRSAGDDRTVPALYPNGFLPNIITTVEDQSIAVGFTGPMDGDWNYDFSINHGESRFDFREENTVNVSWWYEPAPGGGIFAASPTSADTGSLIFDQTTMNLDFRGSFDWGVGSEALFLATGMEWREDNYRMVAGEPVSYTYGRNNDPSVVILGQNGNTAAAGTQGFPGFTPATEVDDGRTSIAFYMDAESRLTEKFLVGVAGRFEHYSDFGSTTTGKLSMRYDATDTFAWRSTVSTGFRAPGVQQTFYSQVSTNLNSAGVLTETLTARQGSNVTQALGIPALQEETSVSASMGFTWQATDNFSVTMDVFQIDIDDRIIFSGTIAPEGDATFCATNPCPIGNILNPLNVGQAQFFTNAIDTRTRGVDIVAEYNMELSNGLDLDLTALMHVNDTEVKRINSPSAILPPTALFDQAQVTLVEDGQPGAQHALQAVLRGEKWDVMGRANYYGSVAGEGFGPYQKWGGEWVFDTSFAWKFSDKTRLTIGANNVFDAYPDKWDPVNAFPFPQLGFTYGWETLPFGINGGYYYAKLDFKF